MIDAGFWWQALTVFTFAATLVFLFSLLRTRAVLLIGGLLVISLGYPLLNQFILRSGTGRIGRMAGALAALLGTVGVLGYGAWLVWSGEMALWIYLFVPALALIIYNVWPVLLFALYQDHWGSLSATPSDPLPTLSVLIPAYNEVGYVGRCIEAVLDADYPREKLELIVIDDGSTDRTYQEAAACAEHDSVRLFHKRNGGKFSALNYGLYFATGEMIVAIDADSRVAGDALKKIVAPMQADSAIGAVAGDIHVGNRSNLLTHTQFLEYLVSINVNRRMYDVLRVVPVIPGCLGAFRRSALEDIGGYDPDTLTEDFDLTIQLLKTGYEVRMSPALADTEAPSSWRDLYMQRIRWYRGNLETVWKHADVFLDPSYGYLHSFAFPVRLLSMVSGPLITILVVTSIILNVLTGELGGLLVAFAAFLVLEVLASILGLLISEQPLRYALLVPCRATVYKVFNDAVALKALFDVVSGADVTWTSPDRAQGPNGQRESSEASQVND